MGTRSVVVLGLGLGLGLVALAWSAAADPAVEGVTDLRYRKVGNSFEVIAPTALLSARINFKAADSPNAVCTPDLLTDHFVGWSCGSASVMYRIAGDQLREVTAGDLFVPSVDAAALEAAVSKVNHLPAGTLTGQLANGPHEYGKAPDPLPLWKVHVVADGLQVDALQGGHNVIPWSVAAPFLNRTGPLAALWRRVIAGAQAPGLLDDKAFALARTAAGWPPNSGRFVVTGATVVDRVLGLEWTRADNGANVTQGEASGAVAAMPGGWRLPSADELLSLVSPADARKVPTACENGKYAFVIAQPFTLSCGLVWTDVLGPTTCSAVGFISGKPRATKCDDATNERFFAVRTARLVTTPSKTVVDRMTGLEWSASDDNGKDVTWDEAVALAKASRVGGHSDWRLPGPVELAELRAYGHRNGRDVCKGFFERCESTGNSLWTAAQVGALAEDELGSWRPRAEGQWMRATFVRDADP